MDDVVIRSRYQRHRVPVRRRKKNYRKTVYTHRFFEKLFLQVMICIFVLLAISAFKKMEMPATDYIIDKVKVMLSQNIDIVNIYKQIDNIVEKISGINTEGLRETNSAKVPHISDSESLSKDSDSFITPNPLNKHGLITPAGTVNSEQFTDTEYISDWKADIFPQEKEVMSAEYISLDLPMEPPVNGTVTQVFGFVEHSISQDDQFHSGIDIEVNERTNVMAIMDGQVLETGSSLEYANYVIIEHPFGFVTVYAHCDKILVEHGQQLKKGEHVAIINLSGSKKVSHLHFEIWKDGIAVDPMNYINVQ